MISAREARDISNKYTATVVEEEVEPLISSAAATGDTFCEVPISNIGKDKVEDVKKYLESYGYEVEVYEYANYIKVKWESQL